MRHFSHSTDTIDILFLGICNFCRTREKRDFPGVFQYACDRFQRNFSLTMRHASTVLLPGLIALAALLAGCGPQQGTPRSQDILLVTVEGNIPAPDDGREYLPRTLVPVSPETLRNVEKFFP